MKNYIYILIIIGCFSCSNQRKEPINYDLAEYYYKKGKKYSEIMQGSEIETIYYDSALYINPMYAKVWWEKSTWEIKIGNYIKYFEYMNKAVDLDPDVYLGWRGVVRLYYLHDYEGALEDFFKLEKMHPNTYNLAARGEDLNFLIGTTYWQKGDFNKAIEYLNKNVIINGEKSVDVYTFVYLGICNYEIGNKEMAKIQFQKSLEEYKECVDAHYYLSKINYENRDKESALNSIQKGIKYANKGYIKRDSYREVFGQIYYSDLITLRDSVNKL
ncbi:hypothetical protein OBK30_12820 [Empedobacter falsenii]